MGYPLRGMGGVEEWGGVEESHVRLSGRRRSTITRKYACKMLHFKIDKIMRQAEKIQKRLHSNILYKMVGAAKPSGSVTKLN